MTNKSQSKSNKAQIIAENSFLLHNPNRILYAKILSIALIIFFGISFWIFTASSGKVKYVSNLGLYVRFIVLTIGTFLGLIHSNIYRVNPPKNLPMDERQLNARRRIFEKSYMILSTILICFLLFAFLGLINISQSDWHILPIVECSVLIGALPSIIASWQKDI